MKNAPPHSRHGALIKVRGDIGFTRAAETRRSISEKKTSVLARFVQGRMDDVKVVQQKS